MNDMSITITLTGAGTAHVCGNMCDCPLAIARYQDAVDNDRAERGAEQRPLADRLRSMRNGAPQPEWFDTMAYQAERLQDLLDRERDHTTAAYRTFLTAPAPAAKGDPALPMGPDFVTLWGVLEETVAMLRIAELLPDDAELAHDGPAGMATLYTGPFRFAARFIEAGPIKAAQYEVTTWQTGDDELAVGRFTVGVDHVRAWCVAWAAHLTHA